jgi:hypothetical protein
MPVGAPITAAMIAQVLVEGAILALVLIGVAHLLRPYARPILFGMLLLAALAYVLFAIRGRAGASWIAIELAGVVLFGTIGWKGLRDSTGWLAAAWALHPLWDIGLHYFGPGIAFVHPLRYPIPCVSFDLLVAVYAAYLASAEAGTAG